MNEIISRVKAQTDSVILFHSATGKDSIALLDMIYPHFSRIVCVYMYMVKGLSYIEKYISWARISYPKIEFVQIPHYALASYVKYGNFGIKQNPNQKLYNLTQVTDLVRFNYGIDWVFYGMKQSDGLNRRLMLKTYELNGLNEKTKKAYPLTSWKNKDVKRYIEINNLIYPLETSKTQSQDTNPNDPCFLFWVKQNYPQDLKRIFEVFPESEVKLYIYERDQAIRNRDNKAVTD